MSKKELDDKTVMESDDSSSAAAAESSADTTPDKYRKLKYGTMFYITIALVVAIVVALNFMVNMVSKRSPIKIDLTSDDRYELSQESIDAVKALDKDVDIIFTAKKDYFNSLESYKRSEVYDETRGQCDVEAPYDLIPELLDKYSLYAKQGKGSINVKYVDVDVDPDIVNKYKKYYNGDVDRGSMIVASGERVTIISAQDVYNMLEMDQYAAQYQGEYKLNFVGESTITAAIANVTDAHPVKAAFAATMNGASMYDAQTYTDSLTAFRDELLAKNGYDCTDIDISTDALDPAEYELVVVYAPSVDFTEDIIKKLSDFLYNDGQYNRNMIYVPDMSKTNLPNIEEFLANWSIKVENNFVVDDKNAIGSNTTIMLKVSDADSVGTLPNEKLPIVAPFARELTAITKNNENIVKSIVSSYDEAYTVSLTDKNSSVGESGARTVVMLSQKQVSDNFKINTSSVLVIGSPFMADSSVIMMNTTYNNANVLTNIVNTLSGKDSGLIIPTKNLEYVNILPTEDQKKWIRVIVEWAIPFIIAAVGVVVLLRRKNK